MRNRVAAALAVAILLGIHVWSVFARAGREPHVDETEYLHAGWLMANGARLYEDFFEHHSPLFFAVQELLADRGIPSDVVPYFERARRVAGAFGLLALLAFAAVVWRSSRHAAAIAVALILTTGSLWLRGFAEVRAEPYALAFFFIGAWLVMRTGSGGRRADELLAGIGIGLVAISCLWQPKWPVACVAVGLFWLLRHRTWKSFLAAVLTTAAGLAAICLVVPLDLWWFFNFELNVVLAQGVQTSDWAMNAYFRGGIPFLYVQDIFHPWLVVPAALLLAASAWIERNAERAFPVALLVAAFIELRVIYPWPAIWTHYYLMWSIASAAVLGLLPSSIVIVMRRAGAPEAIARATRFALLAAAVVVIGAHVIAVDPTSGGKATYFVSQRYLQKRLGPDDVVWLEPTRHPVTVRDAHYYWFSVGQMVGAADVLRRTERGRRYLPPTDDLPPCNASPHLRFTLDPRRVGFPRAGRCMQELVNRGEARKTVFFDVWEIRLKSASQ